MDACIVYVTAASAEEASRIAEAAVAERLAACANILPPITSVYWWEGKVNRDTEVALILKTRVELAERLVARVRALHSYTCPCVVMLPVTGGNPDFLAWIAAETGFSQ